MSPALADRFVTMNHQGSPSKLLQMNIRRKACWCLTWRLCHNKHCCFYYLSLSLCVSPVFSVSHNSLCRKSYSQHSYGEDQVARNWNLWPTARRLNLEGDSPALVQRLWPQQPALLQPQERLGTRTTHLSTYRKWQPTPVLLPGKSHGRRSLVGCSSCSR